MARKQGIVDCLKDDKFEKCSLRCLFGVFFLTKEPNDFF